MAEYFFKVLDWEHNILAEYQNFNNVSFSQELNAIGKMNFSLKQGQIPQSNAILVPERSIISVYRDNILYQNYLIRQRNRSYASQNDNFVCETLECILQDRIVGYLNISSPTIKTVICADAFYNNITLGGFYDFNVNLGFVPTGTTSGITEEFENITLYNLFRKLAATENGFDFGIDRNFNLNFFSPVKGFVRDNVILELNKNVSDITENISGQEIYNKLTAVGENGIISVASSFGSQAAYKTREKVKKYKGIFDIGLLNEKAQDEITMNENVKIEYEISLPKNPIDLSITDFDTGDYLRINAFSSEDQFYLDTMKRVQRVSVTLDTEYNEFLTLEFFEE